MSIEVCARCGKPFIVYGTQWGYSYDGQMTCSYKCMRAMRARDLEEDEMRRLTEAEKDRIRELREQGKSYSQVEAALGGSVSEKTIASYCLRMKNAARKKQEATQKPAEEQKKEEAIGMINVTVQQAAEETVDTARMIHALCTAIELLQRLYSEKDKR